jgi:D-sedoheptulose 7-phosphate isomerase
MNPKTATELIENTLEESIDVKKKSIKANVGNLARGSEMMANCLASGHKIILFGNGGSAADAQHLAAEFINRFQIERSPLAALALTTDTSTITSIGNDYGFNEIFSKQIRALGQKDDIALGISTSGSSENVIEALQIAKQMDMLTMGLAGQGGKMSQHCDLIFNVESDITARVQETHIVMGHILCDLTDRILFPHQFAWDEA